MRASFSQGAIFALGPASLMNLLSAKPFYCFLSLFSALHDAVLPSMEIVCKPTKG